MHIYAYKNICILLNVTVSFGHATKKRLKKVKH